MSANETMPTSENAAVESPETSVENISESENPEVTSLRQEAQKNLEGWQRALAEFQNYKRRTEREMSERYQNGTFDVLMNLLSVVDDFERALSSLPDDSKDQPWVSGVSLIHRKLQKMLDDYQVEAIDPVGEMFDPNQHQAIGADDDTDAASGTVTATLQKGYKSGDRILRPALVKVAS